MTFKIGDKVQMSKNKESFEIVAIEKAHDQSYEVSVDMGRYTVRNNVTGETLSNAPGYLMRHWDRVAKLD